LQWLLLLLLAVAAAAAAAAAAAPDYSGPPITMLMAVWF